MSLYFEKIAKNDKKKELIKGRRNRENILKEIGKKFTRGDILNINFKLGNYNYNFEGICFSLSNKSMISPNTIIKLRNIIQGAGIEITISYFLNRLYRNIFISDYKRKKFIYRSSKLYYLDGANNKKSKIKS